jgi:hypothetical protein
MNKSAIAAIIALAASASAFAQTDVTQDFSVNESRSGSFYYVDYVAKREIAKSDEMKAIVAVVRNACSREDSKQGKYPTVNVVLGKKTLPLSFNDESCKK